MGTKTSRLQIRERKNNKELNIMMNEKDILRRHATHAYKVTDADRAEILAAFAADPAVCF